MNTLKEILLEKIQWGIKATELFGLFEIVGRYDFDSINVALEELLSEGKIIELEYVLPQLNHRIKSFYLPAKIEIKIRGEYYELDS